MAYHDHFRLADDMIAHLDTVVGAIADPFVASRYVGFVSVVAVTVFELAIKDIFCEFGDKKHSVLGTFTRSYFDRINGNISLDTIRREYTKRFGNKYVEKFKKKLDNADTSRLRVDGVSVKSSYSNVITWRNEFAHAGRIPSTVTYEEMTKAYEAGKEVIRCLAEAMQR